jgi:hypothetical protein
MNFGEGTKVSEYAATTVFVTVLNMVEAGSFEMLVTIYEPLRLHIPEIHNIPKFTAVQSK